MSDKTKGWRGSREVWLGAARDAFVESGLDAVKIQPLAKRLGLSRT
ncbi:MAG: TetR/AcrR family transcriptional regulator, partial [Maritimibacter sp.]